MLQQNVIDQVMKRNNSGSKNNKETASVYLQQG